MEAVLTVRLDKDTKERGAAILSEHGYSPSSAVRALFDYVVKHEALPFHETNCANNAEIKARIAAFDAIRTREPLSMTDDELRDERLGSRYGFDA